MTYTQMPPAHADPRACDSVIIEYRTVRREPRLVFDDLQRTAFQAMSELAATVAADGLQDCTGARVPAEVRCSLDAAGPGAYLLGFEVPREVAPTSPFSLFRRQRPAGWGMPPHIDLESQEALLTETRILEELAQCVETICSLPEGRLSLSSWVSGADEMVELMDGLRVLRRVRRSTWRLVQDPVVQDQLRRCMAPFRDPKLYTMTVVQNTLLGNIGTHWTVTTSPELRRFAEGGRLEIPELPETPEDPAD